MLEKITTILFLSGEPLSISDISKILKTEEKEIIDSLDNLKSSLISIGLDLLNNKGEISIVTQSKYGDLVRDFWTEELEGDLTPASLQVLTLVAYLKNPTREEISYIRGVQSSLSIRSLSVRGLIKREGEYCTLTTEALKSLGVTKVEDILDYESISTSLREKLKNRGV